MRNESDAAPFGHTLIIGAGPAGIHAVVNWSGASTCIGLLNRKGEHAQKVKKMLEEASYRVKCDVFVSGKEGLSGSATIDHYYEGYQELEDSWDTVLICTPCDSYASVLAELQVEKLRKVKQLILISPGIGSNAWVQSLLGEECKRIEVVSFSTYYAASKFINLQAPLTSVVKGLKRKIRIASNRSDQTICPPIQKLMETMGIACEIVESPIEAESYSITTYVHPPLFMNEFALNEIFSQTTSRKYMYKLYPEGPITPGVIKSMVLLWKEVSQVLQQLGVPPINLLEFLNDDNYPVLEQSISREEIESFPAMDPVRQEYLLYVRYSSLLIDPYSSPDEQGKYFEFSAVPFKQVVRNHNDYWQLPRVPHEDYCKLNVLYEMGRQLNVPMPQSRCLIEQYRNKVFSFMEQYGTEQLHPGWEHEHIVEQAFAILQAMKINVRS